MKYTLAEKAPQEFAREIDVPGTIADILWNRGVKTKEDSEVFLRPSFEKHVHDPFLFKNMRAAVDRIFAALKNGEHIAIHGDYDADGVTGSTVLYETLKILNSLMDSRFRGNDTRAQLEVYIPHRENEGYGLRNSTVEKLKAGGTKLIITVDCGIASVAECALAHELGMDVIICDHHAMPPKLSETAIIIHPSAPGETYPFKSLAAVGVAYKIATALLREGAAQQLAIPAGFDKWLLDLVAIATVTDVVPLVGENRVLEKFGLTVLQKTKRPGFIALYEVAGIDRLTIDTYTVGFQLGPRINAAGRMKHARVAFDTLTAETLDQALLLARDLNDLNSQRQRETEKMVELAIADCVTQKDQSVICYAREGWPHGLIGLVASKLVQTYGLPAYVVGITERGLVGSGRSIPGFHVTDALKTQEQHLSRFGGHPQACGFTVKSRETLEPLFAGLREHAKNKLGDVEKERVYQIDAKLQPQECTLQLAESFLNLEPFGEGNPKPSVLVEGLKIGSFQIIGKTGKHLRITTFDKGQKLTCIGFGLAERAAELAVGGTIDVIAELSVNEWNDRRDPQLVLKDLAVR